MKNKLSYTLGTPLYEKTQGAETNQIMVYGNIILGLVTFTLWGAMAPQSNVPLLIKLPILATALLLLDRAVWMICHACNKSTVTDAPDAHGFERTSFFLSLLVWLTSISYKQFGHGECDSKPYAAVIVEKGREVTIDIDKDNTLGICEFIQNDASSTLMWALCTVPILLLLGTGWKTLKATSETGEETTWVPFVALICLWLISKIVENWRGFSRSEKREYIAILLVLILVAIVISF